MNSSPLVSIIIPTYNRAHLIGDTLESVYSQSYANWECIVVDDGSSDNTEEVVMDFVRKDQRFQFHHRPAHHRAGGNGARNYGFSLAKGELVNWFDSDDLLLEKFIESKVDLFVENDDLEVVVSKTILKFKKDNTEKFETRTHASDNLLEDFITAKISWYIHDPMWKRSFLLDKKLFSEELLKGQDRDFHCRILLTEPQIYFLDEYLFIYFIHEDRKTANYDSKVVMSHFKASSNRNQMYLDYGISSSTQHILLREQLKLYVNLHNEPKALSLMFSEISMLFQFNLKSIFLVLQFLIFFIFVKLFNRRVFVLR